jgi:3-deoxy-7-phosphoheptulonate synthase
VLLKRGLSATLEEFLLAAEYIMSRGNPNVMLCERGIRTYEEYCRNTLALAAVPALHRVSHLPVVEKFASKQVPSRTPLNAWILGC